MRCIALLLVLLLPLSSFAFTGEPNPDLVLSFTQTATGTEGETPSTLALNLTNTTGNALDGWSTSGCSDALAVAINPGASIVMSHEGGEPEFLVQTIQNGGLEWFVAAVVDFQGVEAIVGDAELHLIDFEIADGAPLTTAVEFCAITQGPNEVPIEHVIVLETSPSGITPTEVDGEVTFIAGAIFGYINGDCNLDGAVTMMDGIDLLEYLFIGEPMPGNCMDSCDFQNDGSIDLSDCIGILQFMFLNGIQPAAPFPDCAPPPAIIDCEVVPACS